MSEIIKRTREACWVIPEIVKLMIAQQNLRAADLCFRSREECQYFARKLALLALRDEVTQQAPRLSLSCRVGW